MPSCHALLVDADAASRRYVRMVLEEFQFLITECDSAQQARQLPQPQIDLLLIDEAQCLDGRVDLIKHLSQYHPAGKLFSLVFTAAMSAELQQQWRQCGAMLLRKPVAAQTLRSTLAELMRQLAPLNAGAGSANPLHVCDSAHAIATYFEGDASLYEVYNEACFGQFPSDLQTGNDAHARGDLQLLRRTAHSLKSVLLTLGYSALSKQAATVESLSHEGSTQAALAGWQALAQALLDMMASRPTDTAGS